MQRYEKISILGRFFLLFSENRSKSLLAFRRLPNPCTAEDIDSAYSYISNAILLLSEDKDSILFLAKRKDKYKKQLSMLLLSKIMLIFAEIMEKAMIQ